MIKSIERPKSNKSTWDFRVMAFNSQEGVCFEVHKIYYDDEGQEKMYNSDPTFLSTAQVSAVAFFMNMLKSASKKPILWRGDRFPEIYNLDAIETR